MWMKIRLYYMWMSTRIFAEVSCGAHNAPMADRHQAQAYPLRLPDDLKARVVGAAAAAGRSLNAEIIARLQQSFESPEGAGQQLYVLLDTNGYVVSWAEIQAILTAMRKAGNFNPSEMHTEIITPDLESSTRRTERAAALAKQLRAGGKSRAIKPDETAK